MHRFARVIFNGNVRSFLKKAPYRFKVFEFCRDDQRRVPILILCVDVCSVSNQPSNRINVAPTRGINDRGFFFSAFYVDVRTQFK